MRTLSGSTLGRCPSDPPIGLHDERAPRLMRRSRPATAVNGRACHGHGVGSLKSSRPRRETYAVRRTVPPSAEIEAQIDRLLVVGVGENPRESLAELVRFGARLII